MHLDDQEEALLRSVALQNARAVLLAREKAERELLEAKQALEQKNRELAEQRESFRVTLSSIGDAVITTDIQGRVTFLNPAAEAITGWTLAEASGQAIDRIFRIINETTRETAPNPMTRAIAEGIVVGLANHTSLIARDGKELAIEDSAAPIRDSNRKVIGAVIVFHDVTRRRRAEGAIEKTAERLQLALDAGRLGDWSWDAATDAVTFSPRAAALFDLPPGAHATRTKLREFLHTDDNERIQGAIDQAVAGKNDFDVEYRVRRSSGDWIWVAARGRGLYGSSGEVLGMIGVVADVTARKQGEELRSTLAAVVESSDDAIVSTTLDGIITTWNEGARRMYGFTAAEAIGKPVTIIIPVDRYSEEPAIIAKLQRGEQVDHYETIRRRKDDSLVDVSLSVSPVRDDRGNMVAISKIARDVTLRKRNDEVRSRLAAVVESSDDAIVSTNIDGVITTWNHAAERMYGFTAAEAIGKPVTIIFPPDRYNEEPALIDKLRRGEQIAHYETIRRRKDGTLVNVSLSISAVRDEHENIVAVSKIARDITERKRSEEALRKAQEELARHAETLERQVAERTAHLRESVESLEAVCYTIAHDLRAPLRAVQGFTKVLLEDYAPKFDRNGQQMAGRIIAGATKMDALIRDLLQYARLSHIDLPCSNVSLQRIVEKATDDLATEINNSKGEIEIEPLPMVCGNATIAEQVFANLLSNSLKFVRNGVAPKIRIWPEPIKQGTRVFIQDNGIGIDPKYHHRLFGMFQRLHGDEKTYPGTGVGLAIVKKGMERMGGSAAVQKTSGPGACFSMDFREPQPE